MSNEDLRLIPLIDQNTAALSPELSSMEQISFRLELDSKGVPHTGSYICPAAEPTETAWEPDAVIPLARGGTVENSAFSTPMTYSVSPLGTTPQETAREGTFEDKLTLRDFIDRCQRYASRTFSNAETLIDDISVLRKRYPDTPFLIQEVKNPDVSGILYRSGQRTFIEITRGNFVTKGATNTSQILIEDGDILRQQSNGQEVEYTAIDGYLVEKPVPTNERMLNVDEKFINNLVEELLIDRMTDYRAIEFGVSEAGDSSSAFVIDCVESDVDLTKLDFGFEIVSPGTISGQIRRVNTRMGTGKRFSNSVFYCDKPEIALLPLVREHRADEIGFVFEGGSMLCHLSNVLRERGIPAVILSAGCELTEGEKVQIDATKSGGGVMA